MPEVFVDTSPIQYLHQSGPTTTARQGSTGRSQVENWRDAIAKDPYFAESETPLLVGRAVVALATDPNVRLKAGLVGFASDLAREYGFTDVDGRVPDFPGFFDAKVRELASTSPLNDNDRYFVWARYCQIHQDPARRALAQLLAKALGLEGLGPGLAPAAADSPRN